MRNAPPFVPNSEDDMHCVNAVFRMLSQHFFGTDYTWEEIDRLSRATPGKATWTFILETEFARKGLNVKNVEPLDYARIHSEGLEYIKTRVGKDTFDYIADRSNLVSVIPFIPEFLARVPHETRRASVQEITEWLKEGKLIGAEVNARALNGKPGLSLHYVLLYYFDGENIIFHDPGLPPVEGRRVPLVEFEKAFAYPGANGETTLFWK